MKNKNKIFFAFGLLFVFIPFISFAAGLVPCGGNGESVCTLCHLITGIYNIISWIRNIAISAALAGITIAGVMYVIAAGDSVMMGTAKKFATACVTGFVITLAAWLLVYTVMWIISVKSDLGVGKDNWYNFSCSTVSTTGGTYSSTNTSSSTPGSYVDTKNNSGECKATNNGCGGLDVTSAVTSSGGCNYTSSNLASKLACLKGKNVGAQVTSVTKNSNSNWCSDCVWNYKGTGSCSHTQNSCHFGGTKCRGTSVAVDLNASSAVAQAAIDCGFDTVIWNGKEQISGKSASDHTDHVHASVDNAACGCDYKK